MYAWPAVFSGSDVVGVSQTGKTLSYLLPLIFTLQHKDTYRDLPKCGIGVSFIFSVKSFNALMSVVGKLYPVCTVPHVLMLILLTYLEI